ncbi:hypothetical protein QA641_03975 [Bradyrhizobium sp. CB1650]|uniref:hypothetical protein n=1 Tax=Bradyrhizobium sp. CB1650 TaxID=3039153 RepID=UPI002435ED04|nr:hypothetical protein [Bradyrhizobium sp. CB1650]WGD53105.1 hypothetical protein QA641_03975 [Bradyrhizobium sp. CB1650]
MIWKRIVRAREIAPRRRFVATAIIYGLSLAVRFTSATGEQVEIAAQSMQTTNPVMSVIARADAPPPYAAWSPNIVQSAFISRAGPLQLSSLTGCQAH